MKTRFVRFLSLVILWIVILTSCGPSATPLSTALPPTETPMPPPATSVPSTPTSVPATETATQPPTATPTLIPIITDGEWTGQDSQGNIIKFTVKDQNISSFIFDTITVEGCIVGYDSNAEITRTIIKNGKFSILTQLLFAPSNNTLLGLKFKNLVISGIFTADNEARGTVKLTDTDCGINMTWTAEKK